MTLNFPFNPTLNQYWEDPSNGVTYKWNGFVWTSIGGSVGDQGPQGEPSTVPGPQGDQGPQGLIGAGIALQGQDSWVNIEAIVSPNVGDAWIHFLHP